MDLREKYFQYDKTYWRKNIFGENFFWGNFYLGENIFWGKIVLKYLFLEFDRDGVGLLQEDGVAPQVVPQRGELVELPLAPCVRCQFKLSFCPIALYVKKRVH